MTAVARHDGGEKSAAVYIDRVMIIIIEKRETKKSQEIETKRRGEGERQSEKEGEKRTMV